jgi:hypothetical protein
MHDYIYPIHPEDEIRAAEEEYLVFPFYPKFTTNGAKLFAVVKSAPKSLIESWTAAKSHLPSANDPLSD